MREFSDKENFHCDKHSTSSKRHLYNTLQYFKDASFRSENTTIEYSKYVKVE